MTDKNDLIKILRDRQAEYADEHWIAHSERTAAMLGEAADCIASLTIALNNSREGRTKERGVLVGSLVEAREELEKARNILALVHTAATEYILPEDAEWYQQFLVNILKGETK